MGNSGRVGDKSETLTSGHDPRQVAPDGGTGLKLNSHCIDDMIRNAGSTPSGHSW